MPHLLSVNVGLPREVTWDSKTVRTAIWKFPVEGRRMVRKLNIDGDGQADLSGHGGEQRAVFVYQMDSYHYQEHILGRNDYFRPVRREFHCLQARDNRPTWRRF
jgi:MOSC domain-containing protein YiiM